MPVPNANTRVEGVAGGPVPVRRPAAGREPSSAVDGAAAASKPVLTTPFGFPYFVLNTKQGPLANVELRQAVQTALNDDDMLAAGFGDPKFYRAGGRTTSPKGTPFYSKAGTEQLQQGRRRRRQEAAGRGQVRRHADPHPHQPAVRLPLPHGAGDGREAQGRRLQGRRCTWSTGRR